jgi:hypothetical protein
MIVTSLLALVGCSEASSLPSTQLPKATSSAPLVAAKAFEEAEARGRAGAIADLNRAAEEEDRRLEDQRVARPSGRPRDGGTRP